MTYEMWESKLQKRVNGRLKLSHPHSPDEYRSPSFQRAFL